LVKIIDRQTDSIRFYRLLAPREKYVESVGVDKYTDFDQPLIL
jgi:CRISPR-associated protein Cas2